MSDEDIKDHTPRMEYFKFNGNNEFPAGVVFTSLMGEVEVGHIHAVYNPDVMVILRSHGDWEKVTKKDYEKQERADTKAEDKGDVDE